MTDEIKLLLGQCLAVGFDGPEMPQEYIDLIKRYKIGNVLLFKRNVHSYEQLKKLCGEAAGLIRKETGHEPFIMTDEECGSVSRIGHIAAPTPCAMATGATGDPHNAYILGKIAGEELRSAGINLTTAPDMDVYSNPDNVVIGNRSFGSDPRQVAVYGLEFMRGLQDAGVFPCAKHFPGHGDTAVDSHLAMPIVDKTEKELRETELISFKAAIDAGIEAIMTAHVVVPAVDPARVPSTVSKKVMTGLLREELGFQGLLISDGMEMNAVMNLYGIEDACRRALDAGCDICLVCHSAQQAASTMEYLIRSVENGALDRGVIEDRAGRVIAWKKKLLPAKGGIEAFGNEAQRAAARKIMDASISLLHAPGGKPLPPLGAKTLFLGQPARAASQASDALTLNAAARFAEAFGGVCADAHPSHEAVENAENVVAFLSRHDDLPALTETVCRLAAQGKPTVAVSLATPRCLDFLPDTVWKVAGWQYDALSVQALMDFMK